MVHEIHPDHGVVAAAVAAKEEKAKGAYMLCGSDQDHVT